MSDRAAGPTEHEETTGLLFDQRATGIYDEPGRGGKMRVSVHRGMVLEEPYVGEKYIYQLEIMKMTKMQLIRAMNN